MIIDASVWGRTLKGAPPRAVLPNVRHMTVHYVGSNTVGVSEDRVPQFIKGIEQGQMGRDSNLSAISYNFLVDKYGRVWEGRGFDYRNAANGANANNLSSLSVCVLVGVNDNLPTPNILFGLRTLWREIIQRCPGVSGVQGHRDVRATACPGDGLYWLVNSGLITGGGVVSRLSGPNRYSTSVAVSKAAYPNGAEHVVLVSGETFPDALSAGSMAGSGPVLLTQKDVLPAVVADEIRRLKPQRVTIVGGPSVVSAKVEAAVDLIVGRP